MELVIFLLLILQIVTLSLVLYPRMSASSRAVAAPARAALPSDPAAASLADPVADLVQELEHAADRANAQVTEHMAQLQTLVETADIRIRTLQELEARLSQAAPALPKAELAPAETRASKRAQVQRLARSGVDSAQIAKRTGLGREEVELLLSLSRTENSRTG